jgi:hypothetical protein
MEAKTENFSQIRGHSRDDIPQKGCGKRIISVKKFESPNFGRDQIIIEKSKIRERPSSAHRVLPEMARTPTSKKSKSDTHSLSRNLENQNR